jgi:hypothetical protein
MKLSLNIIIQSLAMVMQILNQTLDLLSPKNKSYALVAISVLQVVTGVLAHFYNPNGTPASTAYNPTGHII